ncbi:transglutaminase family protein [Sphingomonas sp. RS6]
MRIAIEHRSVYRFSQPQSRLVQMLRLTPCDTQHQTVVSWMIGVDCDARMRDAVDGYGNAVTMLYAEGKIEAIEISVTGEVLTGDNSGVLRGAPEPLPAPLFLRETTRTRAGEALARFAHDATASSDDPIERLHRLNLALHGRFPCVPDRPDTGLTASEAFAGQSHTSRDVAQMFVAGARTLGAPARYVSGYRRFEGSQCAPHGWAEAWVDGLGWVGFDPVAGECPDDRYVRVAVGLDADGAAAIAGRRTGPGDEDLAVDVQVDQLGREE